MKKIALLILIFAFIALEIVKLFVEISPQINNSIYGIIAIFAVYFSVFHLNLKEGIKKRYQDYNDNFKRNREQKKSRVL